MYRIKIQLDDISSTEAMLLRKMIKSEIEASYGMIDNIERWLAEATDKEDRIGYAANIQIRLDYIKILEMLFKSFETELEDEDCESCLYQELEWDKEPCDGCTAGGDTNCYKPSIERR